ncbi:MAG TPA: hypothetical protein VMT35_14525 [Ignavibacteriaceae bacterium]|nr:hypothetical protein [Ignavibacteriaceae bacterium]
MIKILLLLFVLSGCKEQDKEIQIIYFEKGKKFEINDKYISLKEIQNIIDSLFLTADDMLKVKVDSSRIIGIINNESGIEIEYKEKRIFNSEEFGSFMLKKILLPFSGEYIGNEQYPVITIFLGEEDFLSGPLRNSKGLKEVKIIQQMILNAKRRQLSKILK